MPLRLPAELWSLIASNAERSDLTRLALVSSLHYDAALDILASDLRLGSSLNHGYRTVLSSLKQKNVLQRTRHLIIELSEYKTEALDAEAVPVEQMLNLRSLSLVAAEVLFETAELQDAFVLRLNQSCKKLEAVSIRLATFEKVLPGTCFSIPNLHTINWNEGGKPVTL